ncbi:MAG TPA: hypothetical protein VL125_07925 [Pelobium sp.]|nr:hypothetical protein [Pelobium sp.]
MMETLTPTLNSIVNNDEKSQNTVNMLTIEDSVFFESLKPALNQLVKTPSDETVNRILAFSKSL